MCNGLLWRYAHAGNSGRRFYTAGQYLPELKIRVINVVDLMKVAVCDVSTRTG